MVSRNTGINQNEEQQEIAFFLPEDLEGRVAANFVALADFLLGHTVDLGQLDRLIFLQHLGGSLVLGLC
jgi:hypothetical protein